MRPVSWSTSYLLRCPLGISTRTSNSTALPPLVVVARGRTGRGRPRLRTDPTVSRTMSQTCSRKGHGCRKVTHATSRAGAASGGRWLRRVAAGLVVLVLLAARRVVPASTWATLARLRLPRRRSPSPPRSRRRRGSTLPDAARRPPRSRAGRRRAPRSTPAAVRRALARLAARPRARPRTSPVAVAAARPTATVVYRHGAPHGHAGLDPEVLTATAALEALGPDHRFTHHASSPRRPRAGSCSSAAATRCSAATPPTRTAPTRARADLATLARATAERAARRRPRAGSGWATTPRCSPARRSTRTGSRRYVPDDVVSADHRAVGRRGPGPPRLRPRCADPARAAARRSPARCARRRDRGGRARRAPAPAAADAQRARRRCESAPLAQVVAARPRGQRQRGAPRCSPARSALASGGAGVVRRRRARRSREMLRRPRRRPAPATGCYDGSGLSRDDRLAPDDAARACSQAAADARAPGPARRGRPACRSPGFTGSLAYRFDERGDRAGRGRVRAKTGTLTGVHGLAGIVTDRRRRAAGLRR